MRRLLKKTRGVVRGVPSAVLLSALFHFILLFIAGSFVVFSVIKKQEKKFVPPKPIERPKMDLKKPRVKMRKAAAPRTTQRITAKNIQQAMPNIQLPEVSGLSSGLGGGLGGFEMMPDASEMTLLGGKKTVSIGNDFEGTFYSLSLDRRGKRNDVSVGSYPSVVRQFFESDWNTLSLSEYYRWPQKLYTTFFYLPTIPFEHVPRSFGIPDEVNTEQWLVHYKGKIMSKESGKFRFWGIGNHILALRVDGEEVGFLGVKVIRELITDWRPSAEEYAKYYNGKSPMNVGDWFSLEAGKPVDMEVVIGDHNGADTQATLLIEQFGNKYDKNLDGAPILPIFKTSAIPEHLLDEIKYLTMKDDQDLDSNLMFNVY